MYTIAEGYYWKIHKIDRLSLVIHRYYTSPLCSILENRKREIEIQLFLYYRYNIDDDPFRRVDLLKIKSIRMIERFQFNTNCQNRTLPNHRTIDQ